MVASRASILGCAAVLLLGQRLGRASGESTCGSVEVSGIGEPLDGTYTNTPSPTYDHYYYRAGGFDTYTLYQSSVELWYIQNDGQDYQYRTNDLAQHPADITLDWVECVGFLCDDDTAVSQPVVTCVEDPPAMVSSTCTSVTVSRLGEPLDGTYTNTPSPTWDHYYYRAGGSDTYTLYYQSSGELWYIQNDGMDYQYVTNDLAQHPVDISLKWANCVEFQCDSEPAILQPAITCEGDTLAPTPSPTPSASDDDDSETPNPSPAPTPTSSVSGTSPTPAPTQEIVNPNSTNVEDGGLSTGSIVGIIVGVLAVLLGGATLVIKFACREVEFHCFNDCFNRR